DLWKSRVGRKFPGSVVDNKIRPEHIRRVGAPPLGAMARLRSTSLNYSVAKLPAPVGSRRLRRLLGLQRVGDLGRCPGYLTSESEERETWTAESLRAASSRRGQPRGGDVAGRDFGGRRFRSTLGRKSAGHENGPWRTRSVGPRQTL